MPEMENCGICGDSKSSPTPRENEHGGKYGKGIISGTYTAGQVEKKEFKILKFILCLHHNL